MSEDITTWLDSQSETGRNLFTLLHEHSGLKASDARAKVEIVLSAAREKAEADKSDVVSA